MKQTTIISTSVVIATVILFVAAHVGPVSDHQAFWLGIALLATFAMVMGAVLRGWGKIPHPCAVCEACFKYMCPCEDHGPHCDCLRIP